MKHRIGVLISTLIGLLIFIAIATGVGFRNILQVFINSNFIWFIPYLIVSALIILTLVLRWNVVLLSYGYNVSFFNLILYHLAGFATGYLSPVPISGGEPTKAFFLNKEGIDFKHALSSIIIDKSVEMTTTVVFSVMGAVFLILHITLAGYTIFSILIGIVGAVSILVLFYYFIVKDIHVFSIIFKKLKFINKDFVKRNLPQVKDTEKRIGRFFKHHTFAFKVTLLLSVISWLFMLIEYKLLMMTIGYNAGLTVLFLVIAVVAIAYVLPIPAALGVLEGGQASVSKLAKIPVQDSFALSILIRVRELIITFIGLLYMFNYGIKFRRGSRFSMKV